MKKSIALLTGLALLASAEAETYKIYMPNHREGTKYVGVYKWTEFIPTGSYYPRFGREGVLQEWYKNNKPAFTVAYLKCNEEYNKLPFYVYSHKKNKLYIDNPTDRVIDKRLTPVKGKPV